MEQRKGVKKQNPHSRAHRGIVSLNVLKKAATNPGVSNARWRMELSRRRLVAESGALGLCDPDEVSQEHHKKHPHSDL